MSHLVGTNVEIVAEIPAGKVTGTTMVLQKLVNPSGATIITDQAMAFSSSPTNEATTTWQSSISSATGRYTYIVKATNGAKVSRSKSYFDLEIE